MAKQNRTKAATADAEGLEDALIQGAEEMGAAAGNPGHEVNVESTATAEEGGGTINEGPTLRTFIPNPEDLIPGTQAEEVYTNPANVDQAGAQEGPIPLPKVVAQANMTPDLPLMVPESQVIMESDLQENGSAQGGPRAPMYLNDPADANPGELHDQRVKKYGPDYVVVIKGKQQQVFTRIAWNTIRGDKGGWAESVPVPAEVRAIRGK